MQRVSVILIVWITIGSCSNHGNQKEPKSNVSLQETSLGSTAGSKLDSTLNFDFPPFILYTDKKDSTYLVRADLDYFNSDDPYLKLFREFEFSGKGYSWECLIRQILEKENSQLLSRGEIHSITNNFYFWADSKESQMDFAIFVSGKFRDSTILKGYLKTANKCVEES